MSTLLLLAAAATIGVSVVEPQDGGVYDGSWLTLKAIVENDNELPDSVVFSLNGEPFAPVPRLVTDWYTYMANNCRTGYSESPAPHDNTVMWTAPVTGSEHEFATPVIVDGRVYFNSTEQQTAFCLDAATGEEIWHFEGLGGWTDDGMHVQDGYAFLAADSVYCLDAQTGARVWEFGFGSGPDYYFAGPPAVYDDMVYASGDSVYALGLSTGEVVWSAPVGTVSVMTAWNGLLFVPGMNGLTALDTETGETVWFFDHGTYWDSSPCLFDGVIYIGSVVDGSEYDKCLYAIDALDGSLVWQTPELGAITSTPAYHDGRVFFGVDYPPPALNPVFALDSGTGAVEWEFLIPKGDDWLHGSAGVADGLVFWGDGTPDSTSFIRAVDEETGQEVWNYEVGTSWFGIAGSPAITDGVMYIAASDDSLYAFGTGLKWTYRNDLFADVGSNELIIDSWSGGAVAASDTIQFTVTQTGIGTDPGDPRNLTLDVSPNPFASGTAVSFEPLQSGHYSVQVFNLAGRLVRTIGSGEFTTGPQTLSWDGADDSGCLLPAGIYAIRVSGPMGTASKSVCLLR